MAFGEFLFIGSENHRQVGIPGRLPPQSLEEEDLLGGAG